jgi:hypothetical protein
VLKLFVSYYSALSIPAAQPGCSPVSQDNDDIATAPHCVHARRDPRAAAKATRVFPVAPPLVREVRTRTSTSRVSVPPPQIRAAVLVLASQASQFAQPLRAAQHVDSSSHYFLIRELDRQVTFRAPLQVSPILDSASRSIASLIIVHSDSRTPKHGRRYTGPHRCCSDRYVRSRWPEQMEETARRLDRSSRLLLGPELEPRYCISRWWACW